ncbi:MAG: TlpA family protein disulfide reductase [Candidatus Omnitrophica bacterium]|nr:TlpA family protein disulfide reductase [Candidatus Omnitrophota bacterium]
MKVSFVLLLVALFFAGGCAGEGTKDVGAVSKGLGEQHRFALPNLAGEEVKLEALLAKNKAVLLNFWASWCPPCREEIPGLIELQKRFGDSGFTVLGIDVGESKTKVQSFVGKIGINYPVVLDEDMSVSEAYRVVGIPTSFLLNSKGEVLGVYHAYTEELVRDVEEALR